MTGWLARLAARTAGDTPVAAPRIPSRFEPLPEEMGLPAPVAVRDATDAAPAPPAAAPVTGLPPRPTTAAAAPNTAAAPATSTMSAVPGIAPVAQAAPP
ncbi:MAG TPA: hypothetical protein VEZ59_11310, partial [Sphingopyxis sp.]|nr:hypothetical protein [Sphingopyxis sp.]